jgi:hypothetical protein
MNRTLPIAIAVIVLLVAAWYFVDYRGDAPMPSSQNAAPISETAPNRATTPPTEADPSVFESLKNAMGLGKKLACTYTDTADTGISSTVFVDGKKMKFTSTINGTVMYGLFDGETQYTWSNDSNKQGFTMSAACLDEIKTFSQGIPPNNAPAPQDYASMEALQNVRCVPAESEDFSLPTDITFVDQCAMLRDSMKALDQMKQQLPEGMTLPARY